MVIIIIGSIIIALQIITIAVLLKDELLEPDGSPEKKLASRPVTPRSIFTVESKVRKTTVNDDSALFERELER